MRLTVIGCSPAHPNPGGAHSGYLVESDGCGRLLLDCGPGVLPRLLAAELLPVDAIAITHFHLDHWGDLVPWAWWRLYGGSKHSPALWIPPSGKDDLDAFAARWGTAGMFDEAFAVAEYGPGAAFTAAGFQVEAHPVEHYGFPAFGFRVGDPSGGVIGYSGDSAPCDGLRAIAANADLFLCEATLADGAADATPRGHMAADEALGLANGPVLLSHRPAELDVPPGAARAVDGLVVEV